MSDVADRNINRLPSQYKKDSNSNNYKLLDIDGYQKDRIINEFEMIKESRKIDTAFGQSLDYLGDNIDQKRGQLSDTKYRLLLRARQKINLSSGTINEIIEILATVFQVDRSEIKIVEPFSGTFRFSYDYDESEINSPNGFDNGTLMSDIDSSGIFLVEIPEEAINSISFPRQWVIELIDSISAAGVHADLGNKGTFRFSNDHSNPEYNTGTGFGEGTLGAYYDPPQQAPLPLDQKGSG